jgi:hypothetical protein
MRGKRARNRWELAGSQQAVAGGEVPVGPTAQAVG